MSRTRPAKRRSRRSRNRGIAHFLRGLILEGMGVAVLIFLYWSMQSTAAQQAAPEPGTATETPAIGSVADGRYAVSWSESRRQPRSPLNHSGAPGFPVSSVYAPGYPGSADAHREQSAW